MSLQDEMRASLEDQQVSTVFGLDFGTYRSVMAYYDGTKLEVPPYSDACLGGLPSLFWRTTDGKEWVSDEVSARDGLTLDPDGVCRSVKTHLNEKTIMLHGKAYTPHEIAVRIVQRVLAVSKPLLLEQEFVEMEFDTIVCGVPVRFKAPERNEIQSIVQEAIGCKADGTPKEVRLVPEPILAAIAVDTILEQKTKKTPNRPVLTFDMGAGTFDAVLLTPNLKPTEREPYPYIARDPDGSNIAGDCMDAHMEELMLNKLPLAKWRTMGNERHQDRLALRAAARRAKERLSTLPEIDELVTDSLGNRATLHITRAEYEACIRKDLQKNVDIAEKIVRNTGYWNVPSLDIILVGGSTYIPLVKQLLLERFDWLDASHIQQRIPEKAVALGAAAYAARPQIVLPKVAYGYGVSTYNVSQQKDMIHVCIESGCKLPMTYHAKFSTRFNNQSAVQFVVYEVDHGEKGEFLDLEEGHALSDTQQAYALHHDFGRSVPADTTVELTVTLDANGILSSRITDFGISADTEETVNLNSTMTRGGQ